MALPAYANTDDRRRAGRALSAATLAASALILASCGSDGDAAQATSTPTRSTPPMPTASPSLAVSAQASDVPGTDTANQPGDASTAPVTPTPEPTTPLPIPSGIYATIWPAPAGTVPGRCGGNGIDARMYLNGWELCWTEGTISQEFAVNVAQTLAVNNFASGIYDVPSPVGMKTIECNSFLAPNTGSTIINCAGGTITGNGAIELAWLG